MFETEAGFAETKMLINCNGDYSKKQDYKKGWQDGAEFGYNKAKEEGKWHYNDYPKNNDLVLCKDFVDYPFLAYYDGKNWVDTEYETVTCVVSWKYITSPKEIKEND